MGENQEEVVVEIGEGCLMEVVKLLVVVVDVASADFSADVVNVENGNDVVGQ